MSGEQSAHGKSMKDVLTHTHTHTHTQACTIPEGTPVDILHYLDRNSSLKQQCTKIYFETTALKYVDPILILT